MDRTTLTKFLIVLACSLAHPIAGEVALGVVYGREWAQEQAKIAKKEGVHLVFVGGRGWYPGKWSDDNQLDFAAAVVGAIVGHVLRYLVF